MKRYKLLKDSLCYNGVIIPAGTIFEEQKFSSHGYYGIVKKKHHEDYTAFFPCSLVEKNTDWFEEIIEPFYIKLESGGKMYLQYAENTKFRKLIHETASGTKNDLSLFMSEREWKDILKLVMEDQKIKSVNNNLSFTERQADFTFTT